MRGVWHGLCARGRFGVDDARMVLCSRNARSRTPLVGRAQWDHCRRRPLTLKKAKGIFGVLFRVERHIETCLGQCEAKEFAFARAVFDQEDRGVRHHYIGMTSQGLCRARRIEWANGNTEG